MQTEVGTRIFLRFAGSAHEIVDNEVNMLSSDCAETHRTYANRCSEYAPAFSRAPGTGVDGNPRFGRILGMLPSENSAGASTATTEYRERARIACCTSIRSVLDTQDVINTLNATCIHTDSPSDPTLRVPPYEFFERQPLSPRTFKRASACSGRPSERVG